MNEVISKIQELLSSEDDKDQLLAQDMLKQMASQPFVPSIPLKARNIYSIHIIEHNGSEFFLNEMCDVWSGDCFARVYIVTAQGETCVVVSAEECELVMNAAFQAVLNLAMRIKHEVKQLPRP